jgi:Asp-tRNA(Asn)/Glu-tRNA(Gln) amidotransferase A subunit family amidase
MAANLAADYEKGRERLSESLRSQLERGRGHTAFEYQQALARIPQVAGGLDPLFDRYDAILTPAASGTAPRGLESTGSPRFCTLWTFAGMPALNVPILQGEGGLPIGVQLVGRRGDDARLLRLARWLIAHVGAETPADG